jgi:hypothetical protein
MDAHSTDITGSGLAFPIPDAPPSVRPPSAPFAFEVSLSQSGSRGRSDTMTTLHDVVRDLTSRVPFPFIFIFGAALGVIVASLVVAISHHGKPAQSSAFAAGTATTTAAWAPLPVVTIHPAPPEPVVVEAAPVPLVEQVTPPPVVTRPVRHGALPRRVRMQRAL